MSQAGANLPAFVADAPSFPRRPRIRRLASCLALSARSAASCLALSARSLACASASWRAAAARCSASASACWACARASSALARAWAPPACSSAAARLLLQQLASLVFGPGPATNTLVSATGSAGRMWGLASGPADLQVDRDGLFELILPPVSAVAISGRSCSWASMSAMPSSPTFPSTLRGPRGVFACSGFTISAAPVRSAPAAGQVAQPLVLHSRRLLRRGPDRLAQRGSFSAACISVVATGPAGWPAGTARPPACRSACRSSVCLDQTRAPFPCR